MSSGGFTQHFGIGAGDQHALAHKKSQRQKIPFAQNILQRTPLRSFLRRGQQPRRHVVDNSPIALQRQMTAGHARNQFQQTARVKRGAAAGRLLQHCQRLPV